MTPSFSRPSKTPSKLTLQGLPSLAMATSHGEILLMASNSSSQPLSVLGHLCCNLATSWLATSWLPPGFLLACHHLAQTWPPLGRCLPTCWSVGTLVLGCHLASSWLATFFLLYQHLLLKNFAKPVKDVRDACVVFTAVLCHALVH